MNRALRRIALPALLVAGIPACSTHGILEPRDAAPLNPRDVSSVPNAVPRAEPRSRYGNPVSYVVYGKRYYTLDSSQGYRETGHASWYGTKFHGRRTSSGEPYDMYAMTAAHKTLPLPCYVEVRNLANGRSVIVRVNDRGPFHHGRIIDLSYAAAVKLGMLGNGTARVEVRAINPDTPADKPGATGEALQAYIPPAAGTDAAIFLQVGAFSSRDNAERLLRDIEDQNLGAVRIVQAETSSGIFFKVQIGPLADNSEAERISQRLRPLGVDAARTLID